MSITDNTFNTTVSGFEVAVQLDFDSVTEHLSATFGSLTFTGNTFDLTGGNGITLSQLILSKLLNGTATVGDMTISNNSFTGGDIGILFSLIMLNQHEDTRLTTGKTLISNNTFTDQDSAAIQLGSMLVNDVKGTSAVVVGGLTVHFNLRAIAQGSFQK